jgi:predicted AlkP superfamily pyrophosphatase or phosphodiesterase
MVSDHGMAEAPRNGLVDLSKFMKDLPEVATIRVGAPVAVRSMRNQIPATNSLRKFLECSNPHMRVWSKDEMPYRMHYTHSDRIPDVIYFEEPDLTGRVNGPSSQRVTEKIKTVDEQIWQLIGELKRSNLSACINFIIVSDHGMADAPRNGLVDLSEFMKDLPEVATIRFGAPVAVRSRRNQKFRN